MARSTAKLTASLFLLSGAAMAQGLITTASKDDWEEINFEFNSSTLTDGYPSLLRLAELLNKNADHKVKLAGHADIIGSHPYNDRLSRQRAESVKAFLEKYGARPGQISVDAQGKRAPRVDSSTREGRWINRRVNLTVTDGAGRVVSAGGASEAIKALEAIAKKQEECCDTILKRLDKLDEILALVRDLKAQNQKLERDMNELKDLARKGGMGGAGGTGGTGPGGAAGAAAAGPGAGQEIRAGAGGPGGQAGGPSAADLEALANKAARKAVDEMRKPSGGSGSFGGPKFTLLGLNAGPDGNGDITFTGRGRMFAPLGEHTAFQAQAEYMYFRDRKEGQADFGIVNRWKSFQGGAFASFKTVGITEMDSNGTLGQAAFTGDYIFKHGKVGVFGTKSFLDNAVVKRLNPVINGRVSRNILEETYLRVTDQIGGQGNVQLHPRVWLEGNLGYLHSRNGNDKPGGTLRFVFPINNLFAITAEGGVNETLVGNGNNGRATFGVLFGNFIQPRDYAILNHPVPADVPRVRYEILTRRTRTGNDPPVADAGADRFGIAAGTVQLDGSASFDPDGDPIKFSWAPIAPTTVALTGADTARPSFTAAEGQTYSFRLTVTDDKGAQGIARVTISTRETGRVRIIRFSANPPIIRPGAVSTLNYAVDNADSVTITGITTTLRADNGTVDVRPTTTTAYTLTARNRVSEDTATITVIVDQPQPRILRFSASPATILQGRKSTLTWQTQDAVSVDIPGVNTGLPPNGSVEVMPDQTTPYTLIARGTNGEATAATVVTVQAGPRPTIVEFRADPIQIVEGDSSTLRWNVQGADTVEIAPGLGRVDAAGSRSVTPATTTTYTLTATNEFGSTTSQATVEVIPRVRIISFTADPSTIRRPGQPVNYTWRTENALYVIIDGGIGQRPSNGSLNNAGPVQTQVYTLTAIGRGSTATATVTVTLDTTPDQAPNRPPVVVVPSREVNTAFRDLILDASRSSDPDGDPLTFSWRSVDGRGTVDNPTSSRPTVHLIQTNPGDFLFEVTVTDSKGASAKETIRVILVTARPIFSDPK